MMERLFSSLLITACIWVMANFSSTSDPSRLLGDDLKINTPQPLLHRILS